MKKLLFQFDTDAHPASFDTIIGYDGGADQVIAYGNITPKNIKPLVEALSLPALLKQSKIQQYLSVAAICWQVKIYC